MTSARKPRHGISMRIVGRVALLLVCLYAGIAATYSVRFLNGIARDAQTAREEQIPLILSQNRNALKVERAASLIRSVYLAHDRKIERQIQLQLQTLCQSFTLDENQTLIDGARDIAASVKLIVSTREAARRLRDPDGTEVTAEKGEQIKAADAASADAYQHAIRTADRLSETLATDALVLADNMASTIGSAAREVKLGWTLILTLPVLFFMMTLWVVSRHVVAPIGAAVARLESISGGHPEGEGPRTPIFHELATITGAVEAYGALSSDLTRTNALLKILSDRDGLTGLANRRSLQGLLDSTFQAAKSGGPEIGVMMIDLDHFKAINDTYGHHAGDACLVSVATALQRFEESDGVHIGRYGGEEFVALVSGCDERSLGDIAERICRDIMRLEVHSEDGRRISLTASIGVSRMANRSLDGVNQLVSEADTALYQAKRNGRNRVVFAESAVTVDMPKRNRQA
ncbi:GGDEF domain-containing protein [Rhizobium sp. NFR03]|uniref:GGDEF domain-containing protein n=1 Tax=Rhizobium sp. NFR03 TaxID=1566263 RepID=UPI000B84B9AC|nr:GGDEF domain-containing protein [Rhizobium sp. NFR03]